NGGDWVLLTDPVEATADPPDYLISTLPEDPENSGDDFLGWNTKADGTGTEFTDATKVTGDITVYAQWDHDFTTTSTSATYLSRGTILEVCANCGFIKDTGVPDSSGIEKEYLANSKQINDDFNNMGVNQTIQADETDPYYTFAISGVSPSALVEINGTELDNTPERKVSVGKQSFVVFHDYLIDAGGDLYLSTMLLTFSALDNADVTLTVDTDDYTLEMDQPVVTELAIDWPEVFASGDSSSGGIGTIDCSANEVTKTITYDVVDSQEGLLFVPFDPSYGLAATDYLFSRRIVTDTYAGDPVNPVVNTVYDSTDLAIPNRAPTDPVCAYGLYVFGFDNAADHYGENPTLEPGKTIGGPLVDRHVDITLYIPGFGIAEFTLVATWAASPAP
ncbi:MAG: InlB B-repeat-containing protein, partial [Treponema sp.]|nr:InlB B-repeat-containing protein [Treponema sp.]